MSPAAPFTRSALLDVVWADAEDPASLADAAGVPVAGGGGDDIEVNCHAASLAERVRGFGFCSARCAGRARTAARFSLQRLAGSGACNPAQVRAR